MALDEADSAAHTELGISYEISGQNEECVAAHETAIHLNPSNSLAIIGMGVGTSLCGRPDEGIRYLERAFQLNPIDPRNHVWFSFMALSYFTARDYENAVSWALKSVQRYANFPEPHLLLAASLGHLGRTDEAGVELGVCESIRPGYSSPEGWTHTYSRPADNEHLLDGLRKAGLLE